MLFDVKRKSERIRVSWTSVLSVWQLVGSQAPFCSATVCPASGTLGPNEEKEFCVELSANITVSLKTDTVLSKRQHWRSHLTSIWQKEGILYAKHNALFLFCMISLQLLRFRGAMLKARIKAVLMVCSFLPCLFISQPFLFSVCLSVCLS